MRHQQSRRNFLWSTGSGLGSLAFSSLLGEDRASAAAADPLAPKPPHFAPKVKSVIWLFMEGGPSHIDLFDPKPQLEKYAGQPLPPSFGSVMTAMGTGKNTLMPSKRQWKQHGQSGLWVSDWYPNVATQVDEICVLRSCWQDGINHVGSVCEMNTGSILAGRPSLGSWIIYGLGSVNRDLPSYVVMTDEEEVVGGPQNWSSGFLPATFQGTAFRREGDPILDLSPPRTVGKRQQRSNLDLIRDLNGNFGRDKADDSELQARTNSYELAYRMQAAAPDAVDLSKESAATKTLYGMDDEATRRFGTNCLMARRLVERGVRFVELYCGSGSKWDAHNKIEENHTKWCRVSDRPVAGLLTDLKARGLLDSTLVVWGGEFGRTPFNEAGDGRDHNPWGFSMFLAGGGVKKGIAVGTTDEIGLRAVERPIHVHDLHATIMHLLGLDHLRVTYLHNGRSERATVTSGEVVSDVLLDGLKPLTAG